MDFTKLRAAALKDGDDEEAVTVNTRALIDKVLARYSGEWTTLRELIQNAADAQATTVTIKFETLPSVSVPIPYTTNDSERLKHVLLNHTLRRLLVTNNGQKFGVSDWSRLKRIAEGNPDETKIGAFGVGFYSVFADCEDPFVSSGDQAMAFYWKGNSLFTKKLQIPEAEQNPNTSFVLDYRNNTTPMPNLLSIAQFLATSLTFVALQHIELWVDDWRIVSLHKKPAPAVVVPIARDVETITKEGLMKVSSLERESVQMDATFMNVVGWKPKISASAPKSGFDSPYGTSSSDVPSLRSFFSRLTTSSTTKLKNMAAKEEEAFQEIVLEDLTAMTTANVFLRVTTAVIKTSVSSSFAAELERATKKPPPKTTKMALLTSSYDENAASTENKVANRVDLFASVLPTKKPGGRIFIGFPTHQTTGAGMHLSAPSVIPTVERESIDLNARYVRTWNLEMLRVAGIMSRIAYSDEMADLSNKVKRATEQAGHGTKVSRDEISKYLPEALHTIKTFTFSESTPSSQVAQIIEEAFWTAKKQPSIEIYSSRGVLLTTQVRLATEDLSGFVEGIPVVPTSLEDSIFVKKLRDFGIITEITVGDVKNELEAKALSKEQLVQFIAWAGRKAANHDIDGPTIQSLLDVCVAMTGDKEGSGEIISLASIKHYLLVDKIPPDVPIPPTTMPFQFTKTSPNDELNALGWEPLGLPVWLKFLMDTNANRPAEQNMTTSPQFAARILQTLSKSFDGLSQFNKDFVVGTLFNSTVIPTKCGMKKPGESFFASVKLFDDLPTVAQCPGVKEKFLAALGVRKTVDLDTIFKRLLDAPPDYTQDPKLARGTNSRHMELIKYLASVRDDIPAADMQKLKNTPICPAEAGPAGGESMQGTAKLYKVSELFEPKDRFRELGLPVLQWPGPPGSYRSGSAEGKFLTLLGLRPFPSVPELVDLMANTEKAALRDNAMLYFISNHHINGYGSFNLVALYDIQFLPIVGETRRVSPMDCFTNEKCKVLGFNVLKRELEPHAAKFGVAADPPITECVNRLLAKPPQSKHDASTLFKYFADRLGALGQNHIAKLQDAQFIPVLVQVERTEKGIYGQPMLTHLTPKQCYLGASDTYKDVFDFVDFGDQANAFLMKCGSKSEPTTPELAARACKEPARLLGIMQSPEKYLNLLRSLADELPQLKKDRNLFKQMKSAKWLLGSVDVSAPTKKEKRQSRRIDGGDEQYDSDPEDNDDRRIEEYRLASPDKIIIADDYTSYRLFRTALISAPEEEKLEAFYLALGAQSLSSLVQETLRLGSPSKNQDGADQLRIRILERTKLFLYEYRRDTIKHDVRWLEKNLKVQQVSSIALRRSMKGQTFSHTEKRLAAFEEGSRTKSATLYVVADANGVDFYQISASLCHCLLERPNHGSYLTFESFLTLNLFQLRARGYNVERVLRAKQAEQRIAEAEQRKQLEVEQREMLEQEQQHRSQRSSQSERLTTPIASTLVAAAARSANNSSPDMPIPGAFDTSPENSPIAPTKDKNKGGFFSKVTKRLGINNSTLGEAQEQLNNFLGGGNSPAHDHPPSYEDSKSKDPNDPNKGKVGSPLALQQNLTNAINASRPHSANGMFSPPSTQVIKEQAQYCDSTPSQNIKFLVRASNDVRFFVSRSMSQREDEFMRTESQSLDAFAALLLEVSEVYGLPKDCMHIFYDEEGSTIAFNSGGSIFCNFRFWKQLHEAKIMRGGGEDRVEAGSYWWVVLAHELAHNIVGPHNAEHSFYTESLVGNFFPKMMAMCTRWEAVRGPPPSLMD